MILFNDCFGIGRGHKMNLDELKRKEEELFSEEKALKRSYDRISVLRVIFFIAAAVFIYSGISAGNMIFLSCGIFSFLAFIILIKVHSSIDDRLKINEAGKNVIARYLSRVTGTWTLFPDTGEEFLTDDATVARDLDLVGKRSLYQMISTSHTDAGRKRLAEMLMLKSYAEDIPGTNRAVNELAENKDFLIDFETSGLSAAGKSKGSSQDDYGNDTEGDTLLSGNSLKGRTFLLPVSAIGIILINLAAALILIIHDPARGAVALLCTFIIGNAVTLFMSPLIKDQSGPVRESGEKALIYLRLLSIISETDFDAPILKELRERVTGEKGISAGMKKLSVIGAFQSMSLNPLLGLLLNGFLGWDLFISYASFLWSKSFGNLFEDTMDIIASFECLCSLAVLPVIRKTVSPEILDGPDSGISASGIYHPMISPAVSVSNDAHIDSKVTIITGSNMSGKTTFLRTVAINMALSYIGSNVCADSLSLPMMRIFTSMRISDDISGGISTFYAEILRIKEMAEYLSKDNGLPAACFIDEIFRGTNSADRIVGAENAIKKLSKGRGITLVSTHDFELCDLKDDAGQEVCNLHFEEYYENGAIRFDYKLKRGRCTTRNAMALLEMAGLS